MPHATRSLPLSVAPDRRAPGTPAPAPERRPPDGGPRGATVAGQAVAGALLDGTLRIRELPEAARVLGLPQRGRYVVVAVGGGSVPDRVACHDAVVPADPSCRWHLGDQVDRAIVLLGSRDAEAGLDRLAPGLGRPGLVGRVRAGVGLPVDGLGALDVARRYADAALSVSGGAAARLHEHLPAAIVRASPDLATALAARVLGPLLRLPAGERDALLGTLAVWLECGGPTPQAARRLGCHRNTVRNRLRRCELLTGRCLTRPADVVEVGLALRTLELTGHRVEEPGS